MAEKAKFKNGSQAIFGSNIKRNLYAKIHAFNMKCTIISPYYPTTCETARIMNVSLKLGWCTLLVDFLVGRNVAGFRKFRHIFDRPQFRPP